MNIHHSRSRMFKSILTLMLAVGCSTSPNTSPNTSPDSVTSPSSTAPAPSCDSEQKHVSDSSIQIKKFSGEKIRAASDLIMNTFYQNSKASRLPPYEVLKLGEMKGFDRKRNEISKGSNSFVVDLSDALKSQYYIKCELPKKSQPRTCEQLCEVPPSYIWGGMGWYEKASDGKSTKLNLFRNFDHTNVISRHPGLDCSGLVYSILATAGLRVNRDLSKEHSAELADNTPARTYLETDSPTSCFTEIKPAGKLLAPGDLITWRTHILLVDQIGTDPFGINHINRIEDCKVENIRPQNSTLVAMNSKGGFDFPKEEIELEYLANAYYAAGLYQHMLMYDNFVKAQMLKATSSNLVLTDPARLARARAKISEKEAQRIESLVKSKNLMLTGVGVGISKMYFGEMMLAGPQPLFQLAIRACEYKFGKEPAPGTAVLAKVVRHLASVGKAPCECINKEVETIHLEKKIDPKTSADYCSTGG